MGEESDRQDVCVMEWVSECHVALSAAEALAARLSRLPGGASAELAIVRMRIAALRAELERRKQDIAVSVERRQIDPNWAYFVRPPTPWCPPGEHD